MRALCLICVSALAGLWTYYAVEVAPADDAAPVLVQANGEELSAATLNNEGVQLDRRGRDADALLYFERAHRFRPRDETIATNYRRQQVRVAQQGWGRILGAGTFLTVVLLFTSFVLRIWRWLADGARLGRVRLRGDPWIRIPREGTAAELPLRFSAPVAPLLKRHPLTIVWSSAAHGKHMKSRPPVEAAGRACTVKLDRNRLERLRRYPGDWRGFLYLGKTPVGETAARVV